MSQTLTPKNVANRRSFLALAIATAAIVPISESALARGQARSQQDRDCGDLTHRRMLPVIKRRFKPQWLFEIFGSVTFSGCGTFRSPRSTRTIRRSRPRSSKQLQTRKLSPRRLNRFMAPGAKDSFFKLLAGHYGAVKAYLVATVAGDASAQAKATQALTSNAEEIATFLSKANPYLPKDAVQGLLLAHGGHHIQQIQQLKDRKYEAEAQTWEEMKKHVYQIADATADALAKQFAKKFS